MKLLIGLVGQSGAGKGTVGDILEELCQADGQSVEQLTFSGPLRWTLDYFDIPATRDRLQLLGRQLEELGGPGTLSHKVIRLARQSQAEVVILDGVRWMYDYEAVRQAEANVLVYVTAEAQVRFDRMKQRGQKAEEHRLSWQQFEQQEAAFNEQSIPEIGQKADVVVNNDGSIAELRDKVVRLYEERVKVLL